jgi:hypothetical protein
MKKIIISIIPFVVALTWCSVNHNFMNIDNPNSKGNLENSIWNWNLPKIDTKNIIPGSLSWKRNDAKWYANKYYDDTLQEYVNAAKSWLSWAKETMKWYYNSWVDQLNTAITDKVNEAISWELNKFKIK